MHLINAYDVRPQFSTSHIKVFFLYIIFKESLKLARSLFVSSHCIQWEVQMTAVKLRLFPTSRRRSHGEMQPIEAAADGATIWRCQKVEKKMTVNSISVSC